MKHIGIYFHSVIYCMVSWSLFQVTVGSSVFLASVIMYMLWKKTKEVKKKLQLKIKVKQGEALRSTIKARRDHWKDFLKNEKYGRPFLPDSIHTISKTNEWETCFDINPFCAKDSWLAISEYLLLCSIDNENPRQALTESFMQEIGKSFTKNIPFPISWFLPSKYKNGNAQIHPLQALQMSLAATPGLITALAEIKNFVHTEFSNIQTKQQVETKKKKESKKTPKLPNPCPVSELYSVIEKKPDLPIKIPQPLDKTFLPGLCKGFAPHNPLAFTGKHAQRNIFFSSVCNRFHDNLATRAHLKTVNGEHQAGFTLMMPDNTAITSVDGLVDYLIDHGCTVSCHIRIACAVMSGAYCVDKAALGEAKNEGEEYYDVPFAFFCRSGVHSHVHNAEAITPLLHGGLNLNVCGELEGFGDISFQIQYYLSFGGSTRWHARNSAQDLISWNTGRIVDEWTERKDVLRAVRLASWNAAIFNGVGIRDNLYFCGYGLLGVCSDSVAPIQHILRGKTTMYPLLARGQYKIRVLKEIRRIQNDLKEGKLPLSEKDKEDLAALFVANTELPNDNYLNPLDYKNTLQRIEASLPWEAGQEPFASVVVTRQIIAEELKLLQDLDAASNQ